MSHSTQYMAMSVHPSHTHTLNILFLPSFRSLSSVSCVCHSLPFPLSFICFSLWQSFFFAIQYIYKCGLSIAHRPCHVCVCINACILYLCEHMRHWIYWREKKRDCGHEHSFTSDENPKHCFFHEFFIRFELSWVLYLRLGQFECGFGCGGVGVDVDVCTIQFRLGESLSCR